MLILSLPFPNISPVVFSIPTPWFPLSVRWYGLGYVVGIFLAWQYALGLIRNPKLWSGHAPPLKAQELEKLILWITLGIVIGGRLGYMLFYANDILFKDPWRIFATWEGGMSFHGGLIGVCFAVIGFSYRHKRSLLSISDLVAPCVPIGLGLVRLANFINGELWGRPTQLPWGMVFPRADMQPRHPSQIYEAGLEGLCLFLLLRYLTHKAGGFERKGLITGSFLALYGCFRFLVEQVREPDIGMPEFPFGLSMGMILSLPMILIGAWLIIWTILRAPRQKA